jgi:transposase-like protein
MKDIAAGPSAGKVTPSGHQAEVVPRGATSGPDADEADVRARPGRRTVEERQQAVLDVLAGKATVDQIARRLGVQASTVESWRDDAMGGIAEALRRGSGKTARELELERELDKLRKVVTTTAIQKCLLEQALEVEREKRPTGPARSRR